MSPDSVRPSLMQALNGAVGKGRILPMEGMRGMAVLLVFFVHHHSLFQDLLAPGGKMYQISEFAHAIGHSGVDLFYVLSGFLIYGHLMERRTPYLSFVRKRVRRIYPTFTVVFGLYWMCCLAVPSASKLPNGIGPAAMYLFENFLLLPGMLPINALVTVAWSLSYEFFFYLSIPLIIIATGMYSWRRRKRVLFILILAVVCNITAQAGLHPYPRLIAFLAGILLYETVSWGGCNSHLNSWTEVIALCCYAVALAVLALFRWDVWSVRFQPIFANFMWAPWAGFWLFLSCSIYFFALHGFVFRGWIARFFSITPLRWLGNMSYSYFLLHALVLNAVAFALHRMGWLRPMPSVFFAAVLLFNFLLTLGFSLVLFWLVERTFSLAPVPPAAVSSDPVISSGKVLCAKQ